MNNDKPVRQVSNRQRATQWKPGQSGNPAGRPPNTRYISEILREKLLEKTSEGKTHAELIAEALIELSKDAKMRGFVPAIKELLDRIEGKVPETHKFEGDVPVIIQPVVYERREDATE